MRRLLVPRAHQTVVKATEKLQHFTIDQSFISRRRQSAVTIPIYTRKAVLVRHIISRDPNSVL